MGYDLEFKYVKGTEITSFGSLAHPTANQTRNKSEEEIETTGMVIEDQSVTSRLSEIADDTAKESLSENWSISKRHLAVELLSFFHSETNYHSMMELYTLTEMIAL